MIRFNNMPLWALLTIPFLVTMLSRVVLLNSSEVAKSPR